MAVDTRNKRASCIGFAAPFRVVFPNPDGSLTASADRQQIAYSYAGIEADEAVTLRPQNHSGTGRPPNP